MLATVPRAGRRALTTATTLRAPLAPPYAHPNRSALAPPYTNPLAGSSTSASEDRLKAPYAFQLNDSSRSTQPQQPSPREWVASVLATDAGKEWALAAWDASLAELKDQPATTPEIPFQVLTAVLADPTTAAAFSRAGAVVVRDVVRDALAEAWAKDVLEAMTARGAKFATYYSQAQVDARADPSVLSAASQLLKALVPSAAAEADAPTYVRVDAAMPFPTLSSWAAKGAWDVDSAAHGFTPVHAHLALARTDVRVPTSTAAATYTLLRPHFAPRASRISFYHADDYLAPANWALRGSAADYDAELPHIRAASVALAPGDVLVSHAGLRVHAADAAGLLQPVHPLPATEGNTAFITRQRAAFEAGTPPPHAEAEEGGAVAIEHAGDSSSIASWGGRRAMGYGH